MALLIESMLKPLSWDSAHFGVEVAKIEAADIDDRTLQDLLVLAEQKGFSLVYWAAGVARVPDDILQRFSGLRVDRKATYVVDLDSWSSQDAVDCRESFVRIIEYPRGPAAGPLLELGRAANVFSRFVNDPRIPAGKANELFEIWINKSTLGEMAEVVLVAQRAETPAGVPPLGGISARIPPKGGTPTDMVPVGMVTVSRRQDGGQIGLIAVDPAPAAWELVRRLFVRRTAGWSARVWQKDGSSLKGRTPAPVASTNGPDTDFTKWRKCTTSGPWPGRHREKKGGRRKAEGGRRKAEGGRRKAEGGRRSPPCALRLPPSTFLH